MFTEQGNVFEYPSCMIINAGIRMEEPARILTLDCNRICKAKEYLLLCSLLAVCIAYFHKGIVNISLLAPGKND